MKRAFLPAGLFLLAAALLGGCSSVYYDTMEAMGVPKRDILVDRVEEARDTQSEAREEFSDALEQFRAVVNVPPSELSRTYDKLKATQEDLVDRAEAVSGRIDKVESVATALFREWENELDQYTRDDLRRLSANTLEDTRAEYKKMIRAMRRAESKMEPVTNALNDQVLFLKHNLNAQAIASLQGELDAVEDDIAALIEEMNAAIAEADAFIKGMSEGPES